MPITNKPGDAKKLLAHVRKFITDNRIDCAESIYQVDRVIQNAYEFIEGCCEIAGYHDSGEAQ